MNLSDFDSIGNNEYVFHLKEVVQEVDGIFNDVKIYPAIGASLKSLISNDINLRVGLAVCNKKLIAGKLMSRQEL